MNESTKRGEPKGEQLLVEVETLLKKMLDPSHTVAVAAGDFAAAPRGAVRAQLDRVSSWLDRAQVVR